MQQTKRMKKILKKIITKILSPLLSRLRSLEKDVEQNRIMMAQILIRDFRSKKDPLPLSDVEFKVFSQWGEDGIIQYLISRIPIENRIFIEFGVEDYCESNTRFLLMNNNWKGLVIDDNSDNIDKIKKSDLYWRYELIALNAFVTKDNIDKHITASGISGDIGLLSIDVDGNDYWIWQAIDVISPRIVICEYNSLFGYKDAVTIPYSEQFNRTRVHHSNLYFGASLKALCLLGEKKGYVFVGSESAGVNAFFVRKELASDLMKIDCRSGYVASEVRESRDKKGRLSYVGGGDRIKLIGDLKVIDIEKNIEKFVRDIS
jgi:hypothetical protein